MIEETKDMQVKELNQEVSEDTSKVINFENGGLADKDEEQEKQELNEYLKGYPTREEMSNYLSNIMQDIYVPAIMESVSKTISQNLQFNKLSILTLQMILISKGITTPDEFEELLEEILKKKLEEHEQQQSQEQEQENKTNEENVDDAVETKDNE